MLIAVCEWFWLTKIRCPLKIINFLLLLSLGIYFGLVNLFIAKIIFTVAACWWGLAAVALILYPKFKDLWAKKITQFISGVFIILPAWLGVLHLWRTYGAVAFLSVCIVVWAADSVAYFTGKAFGRHKLLPKVSPGKTMEGVGGALLAIALLSFVLPLPNNNVFIVILLGIVSIVGDLTESLFKRVQNVKNSSEILPGHGGILDRLDALLAVMPIYCFLLFLLKGF